MKKGRRVFYFFINTIIVLVLLAVVGYFLQITLDNPFGFLFGQNRVAVVVSFEGDVSTLASGSEKPLKAFKNMRLVQGDRIITGEKSWVELKIDDDKTLVISENSNMSFIELSGSSSDAKTVLSLQAGNLWTNIKKKLNVAAKFEVKTPTAIMGVRGTQFFTSASKDNTKVAVLEGAVGATLTILTRDPQGVLNPKEITLMLEKEKQVSLLKDQVTTEDELNKMIQPADLSTLDIYILNYIRKNPQGINPELLKEVDRVIGYKEKEKDLIDNGKVQLSGTVIHPDGKINTEGGHIHIRNAQNQWVFYGLLNKSGGFVAGDLPDGTYWLRSDPAQSDVVARSNEIQFNIKGGKAEPSTIQLKLNPIQISASIVNPEGAPVRDGTLYISDSKGSWIYYDELEGRRSIIHAGGLPDGAYKIVAYPLGNSGLVPSAMTDFSIRNGKAEPGKVLLKLNLPQFSGKIMNSTGGHVHVRDIGGYWIQYVNADEKGGFKIGGLKDGTYWIRADSSEAPGYRSSEEYKLVISNGKAAPETGELMIK